MPDEPSGGDTYNKGNEIYRQLLRGTSRAQRSQDAIDIARSERDPKTGYRFIRRYGYHSPRRTYRGF